MVHLIIEVSKYLRIVLLAIYTYQFFSVFLRRSPNGKTEYLTVRHPDLP